MEKGHHGEIATPQAPQQAKIAARSMT